MTPYVYVVGSLRNGIIPEIANNLQEQLGWRVFADWHASGPEGDDHWQRYERARGVTSIVEALARPFAQNTFQFDRGHLAFASHVVLVMPAGKSACLELGWALGRGAKGYVLFLEEPERWDVMFAFADGVFTEITPLVAAMRAA
jgi:hypothetical protein